jgi:glycosyltransferase involved in cell wall biosynthesis
MNKKILFISHDASRTGAPILLLNLIEWLITNKKISADILILNSRPWHDKLISDFSRLGKVYLLNDNPQSYWDKIRCYFSLNKKVNKYSNKILLQLFRNKNYDLIYANTVVTSIVIPDLRRILTGPIVMHIHELEIVMQKYVGINVFKESIPVIDKFILANSLIKKRIFDKYNLNIPSDIISIFPEYISNSNNSNDSYFDKSLFRENCDIILGAGTLEWRKGIDLFIQTAIQYKKISKKDFIFCWIGGEATIELNYEIEIAGLFENVKIIRQLPDISHYFKYTDVFFLSSREDPYPLVCLEASKYGCPIVCFKDSGGMNDFVTEENGIKVNFMDTLEAAESIKCIVSNAELRKKLSLASIKKAEDHHIDLIAEKIWSYLFDRNKYDTLK